MSQSTPLTAIRVNRWLPAVTAMGALCIFLLDALTPLDIAIAVLYGAVVMVASTFCSSSRLLAVALFCAGLTIAAFFISHSLDELDEIDALGRCMVSLAAIFLTALLSLRNQRVTVMLREQANLLALSHDAIFVRDIHDAIRFWNHGAQELYGWPPDATVGRNSHVLLQTRFSESLDATMAVLLRDGRWEGELIQRRHDGSELIVASRWSLVNDSRGRALAILESNIDITERKRAEALALRQERELRLALDTLPSLVWTAFPEGDVDYANAHWVERGFAPQALRAGWSHVLHPDDLALWWASWEQALVDGSVFETEARLRRDDGVYRWFLHRAVPLRDENGDLVKWYAASTDIEDRKRAEQRSMRAEHELREAIDTIPAMVWSATPDMQVNFINKRWADMGLTLEDVSAQNWRLVCHPDDLAQMERDRAKAIHNRSAFENTSRLRRGDGEYRWLLVRGLPLLDHHGQVLRWYGVNTDIEQHRRAEDALHRAQAELAHANRVATLGELTASIAHEVNQPLAAIVTNGEACLRWLSRPEPQLKEVHSGLTRVISEGRRASEVIRRLRALARKGDAQKSALNLTETIDEALILVQRELIRQRIGLQRDYAAESLVCQGDRVQLQQVVINLVVNAIQAMAQTENRSRTLSIRTRLLDHGQAYVGIQDSGPGIAADHMDRLFTAFFTTKGEGMGMGLSICRSIIDAHGGKIWVSSPEGEGALFQFVLPTLQVAA
ncbi:MAG: PAS domain-containing protein [Dyella sp.]